MSINNLRIPEKIKCLSLLRDMKINTEEVEIRVQKTDELGHQ